MKEYWACGRTRDVKGNVEGWHLNPYVNCIHTLVGHSRLNMEVLIAEFDMSEIKYIGQISSSQNSRVIDPEGISYAVTNGDKDGEPKIIEPISCAMRGRNPENPSERGRSNGKYKQRIEMGSNISNSITTVQKDSLVAEPNVLTPKRTEFGKQIRKKYESGEVELSRHDMTQLEPRKDGVSNTIISVQKDNLLAEPLRIPQATKKGYIEVPPGSLFDMSYPESTTRRGRVQEGGTVSPTLMASGEAPCHYEGKEEHSYRIRKLTPKECFRLMGVSEADIEKIQRSGVSQSQQYKMAGNSIVVDVLEHIFRKLFVDTGQESQQLQLF